MAYLFKLLSQFGLRLIQKLLLLWTPILLNSGIEHIILDLDRLSIGRKRIPRLLQHTCISKPSGLSTKSGGNGDR